MTMGNYRRTPKNYNGVEPVAKNIGTLALNLVEDLGKKIDLPIENLVAIWKEAIGDKFFPLTKVVSLVEGVLTVKVKGATLFSLLSQYEKTRLLSVLQSKVSKDTVRKLVFRIE